MKKILRTIVILLIVSAATTSSDAGRYVTEYKSLSLTEEDVKLIAKAVRAEVPNESYLTKACVAAMIMNRMKDPVLGANAADTVYEDGAFLYANKASIDRDVSDEELFEYTALVKLVAEYGIDPTCGALFCFTEGDRAARRFSITLSSDGFLFAKP